MDPIKPLSEPTTEIRTHANHVDSCGETWIVLDGIETKVPSIKAARILLAKQDALRIDIRAELDKTGIRDQTVQESLVIDGVVQKDDEGNPVTVEMLPPGAANVLQIGCGDASKVKDLFDALILPNATISEEDAEKEFAEQLTVMDLNPDARLDAVDVEITPHFTFTAPSNPEKFPVNTAQNYIRPGRFIPIYAPKIPLFQWFPERKMFIFNEGGRFLTLSLNMTYTPFRLYILGWVLMYSRRYAEKDYKWSFRRWL
jgi:hypothetical protein